MPIHQRNQVARLNSRLLRRASRLHTFDHDSTGSTEFPEQHRVRAVIFAEADADGSARDFPRRDQLVVNIDDGIRRKREPHTFKSVPARINRGIDPDHFPGHVDQRSA